MKKKILVCLCILVSCMMGCAKENIVEQENKVEIGKQENEQINCKLEWRVEENYESDITHSYLYLYAPENKAIECKVGYIVGSISDIEEYKDTYPEDGVIPISSWFGGQGVEIVGQYEDANTLDLMWLDISEGEGFKAPKEEVPKTNWEAFEPWCRIHILYDENGNINDLQCEKYTQLYNEPSEEEKLDLLEKENEVSIRLDLKEEDFTVTTGEDRIILNMLYDDLNISQVEIPSENTLMTEQSIGDYFYKYYLNRYEAFSITSSNLNYNIYGDDFDTYYIVGIALKSPLYKTARGCYVGNTREEIEKVYGKDATSGVNSIGMVTTTYRKDEKSIEFTYDEEGKVVQIYLEQGVITPND